MKKFVVSLGIMLLLFTMPSICVHTTVHAQDRDITWESTLHCNESSGLQDTVVFGEAPDAHDGPPADTYDVVKPPTPMIPFVRIILKDNLPVPYNTLWEDFRQYPDTTKIWNVSVQWVPEDGESSGQLILSWNPLNVSRSEYTTMNLCTDTGSVLQDMLAGSSYSFTCPANIMQRFKIICEQENTPPPAPTTPAGNTTGYHGTSYTYTTTGIDPDNDNLYYSFNWGDGTTGSWLGPYPSGQQIQTSHAWATPGVYPVKVKTKDAYGAESAWSQTLPVTMGNRAPSPPSNPSPADGQTDVSTQPTLHWTGSDPDADVVTYDVYFGATNDPPRVVSQQSSASFSLGSLTSQTTYHWLIVTHDPYGLNTTSPTWSFTTSSDGSSGGDQGTPSENQPPTADASASEHTGVPGTPVLLNGSRSSDPDGYITSWVWVFGDDHTGTGETTSHVYNNAGSFQVTLTVTDNYGATDTDTILVQIITANHPPSTPIINGTTRGTANTRYSFTITASDPENEFLSYKIAWGDGTVNVSDAVPNGTSFIVTHHWTTPGKYLLTAVASDPETMSEETLHPVFIDVYFIGSLGFLYDTDRDTVNDTFFSNESDTATRTVKQADGTYQLDTNGDGRWDSIYDPLSGSLKAYSPPTPQSGLPVVVYVLIALLIIIGAFMFLWSRRR